MRFNQKIAKATIAAVGEQEGPEGKDQIFSLIMTSSAPCFGRREREIRSRSFDSERGVVGDENGRGAQKQAQEQRRQISAVFTTCTLSLGAVSLLIMTKSGLRLTQSNTAHLTPESLREIHWVLPISLGGGPVWRGAASGSGRGCLRSGHLSLSWQMAGWRGGQEGRSRPRHGHCLMLGAGIRPPHRYGQGRGRGGRVKDVRLSSTGWG